METELTKYSHFPDSVPPSSGLYRNKLSAVNSPRRPWAGAALWFLSLGPGQPTGAVRAPTSLRPAAGRRRWGAECRVCALQASPLENKSAPVPPQRCAAGTSPASSGLRPAPPHPAGRRCWPLPLPPSAVGWGGLFLRLTTRVLPGSSPEPLPSGGWASCLPPGTPCTARSAFPGRGHIPSGHLREPTDKQGHCQPPHKQLLPQHPQSGPSAP